MGRGTFQPGNTWRERPWQRLCRTLRPEDRSALPTRRPRGRAKVAGARQAMCSHGQRHGRRLSCAPVRGAPGWWGRRQRGAARGTHWLLSIQTLKKAGVGAPRSACHAGRHGGTLARTEQRGQKEVDGALLGGAAALLAGAAGGAPCPTRRPRTFRGGFLAGASGSSCCRLAPPCSITAARKLVTQGTFRRSASRGGRLLAAGRCRCLVRRRGFLV
jgi:hypothetical protein